VARSAGATGAGWNEDSHGMTENAGLPRPARLRGMILIDPVLYISIALAPSVAGLVLYQRTSRLRLTG
jgi:hypothetical protein